METQEKSTDLIESMASQNMMTRENYWKILKKTLIPTTATDEQVMTFLAVAHRYNLDPFSKEIYAFPAKGGGIVPVIGVDGWIARLHQIDGFDGLDFEDGPVDESGKVDWMIGRFHFKQMARPIVVKEWMRECERNTDPWRKSPNRMLRHKVVIQGVRLCRGYSGVADPDSVDEYDPATYEEVDTAPNVSDLRGRVGDLAGAMGTEVPSGKPGAVNPEDASTTDFQVIKGTTCCIDGCKIRTLIKCPGCGKLFCAVHFDREMMMCIDCGTAKRQDQEAEQAGQDAPELTLEGGPTDTGDSTGPVPTDSKGTQTVIEPGPESAKSMQETLCCMCKEYKWVNPDTMTCDDCQRKLGQI